MELEVKILGAQCEKCERLFKRVKTYIEENNMDATIEKIEDIDVLTQYNAYCLPVLLINNKVVLKGYLPSDNELKKLFHSSFSNNIDDKENKNSVKKNSKLTVLLIIIFTIFSLFLILVLNKENKVVPAKEILSLNDSLQIKYNHVLFQRPYQISILEFGSGYCKQCKRMQVVMDSLRNKYSPILFIECINLREKSNRRVAQAYNIEMIPAQVILDRRGNIISTHTGFLSEDSIKSIVLNHFNR